MEKINALYGKLSENIHKVIVGKEDTIKLLYISLLCGGHILIEDVPGTGKTMLVKSFSASLDCSCKRIQFTPDLMPSDITGINYYNMKTSDFELIKGPIFANIVLADEINRATPKTQSGLLECMEERQATIDGTRYPCPDPFMIIATQNPLENMGTFPLPEAQIDRFFMKCSMSYPKFNENVDILERFNRNNPLTSLQPVANQNDVLEAMAELNDIYIHRDVLKYITFIVEATRSYPSVVLGSSPRGALALMKASKCMAAIEGRKYVLPDDVKKMAVPTLAHRLMMTSSARLKLNAGEEVIKDIVEKAPVPTETVFDGVYN